MRDVTRCISYILLRIQCNSNGFYIGLEIVLDFPSLDSLSSLSIMEPCIGDMPLLWLRDWQCSNRPMTCQEKRALSHQR